MWGRVRRGLLTVGTSSTRSGACRYVFGEVSLVSGSVRRGFHLSGHVRRGRFSDGHVRRGRVNVGTCSAMSVYSRDVFGDVGVL